MVTVLLMTGRIRLFSNLSFHQHVRPPPPPFQSHSFSPHLAKFIPGPFVTAVGGTVNVTEQAVFFSGGGFSRLFPQPSYQKTAVKGFLKSLGSEFKGLFNAGGRGYPDVAAQGLK